MVQIRDLSVVALPNGDQIVTAVDISAGIGEKEHDVLQVSPELTGKLTLRVALLEVLACGAEIVAVSDVIGAEMTPTGQHVIRGIQQELIDADLAHIELNGSTEENMKTSQTSVGVFVTGYARTEELKVRGIQSDAIIFGFGEPRMGQALLAKPTLEVTYSLVRKLVKDDTVLEVVPVGSKGILYEANALARLNKGLFREDTDCNEEWLTRSAGPSTAIIIAVKQEKINDFQSMYPEAYIIGKITV